jgi:hypothetical protein
LDNKYIVRIFVVQYCNNQNLIIIMIYSKLEVLAHAAETEDEIADAKTAVLGSEKLISEDELNELLNLLNAKQDALEEEGKKQYRQFLADANSHYLATR